MFVSGECPVRVAAACRGPKAERARQRVAKVAPCSINRIVERSSLSTFRPTRCRALSSGGTPLGKPASGSWFAPVGATIKKTIPCAKILQKIFPPPTASTAPVPRVRKFCASFAPTGANPARGANRALRDLNRRLAVGL